MTSTPLKIPQIKINTQNMPKLNFMKLKKNSVFKRKDKRSSISSNKHYKNNSIDLPQFSGGASFDNGFVSEYDTNWTARPVN